MLFNSEFFWLVIKREVYRGKVVFYRYIRMNIDCILKGKKFKYLGKCYMNFLVLLNLGVVIYFRFKNEELISGKGNIYLFLL